MLFRSNRKKKIARNAKKKKKNARCSSRLPKKPFAVILSETGPVRSDGLPGERGSVFCLSPCVCVVISPALLALANEGRYVGFRFCRCPILFTLPALTQEGTKEGRARREQWARRVGFFAFRFNVSLSSRLTLSSRTRPVLTQEECPAQIGRASCMVKV